MAGELRKLGVRLTAEGVNQYKDDLRSAGSAARLMSQETKIAMLELGEGASSADKFQTQLKSLDREYDVQKNKLKTLSNAQKEFTTSLGLVEREITSTTSALKTSQSETNRLEKEYRTLAKTTSNSAIETNKAKQAFQDSSGTLKTTQNETNRLEKEYRELGKTLGYNATETKKAKQAWQESAAILKSSQADTNRLEKEYRELAKASGLNATETKKAKQAWQESKQETKELATNLNKLEKDQSQYTKELDKMPGKINAAKISMGELSNEMQQLNREYIKNGGHLADVSAKLTSAGDKVKSFSSGLQSAGSTLTTGVTLPLVAMGTAALMAGVKFEQQMSRVGSIADATKEELGQLTEQAKELGASTAFSASEVAAGMENMASAGFTVSEIMNAMSGVLDLAAVSGGDVALASEAAATAINAFKLEAGDAGHVADVFARAAADTNAEVGDMAEALKYAAPPAANLGLSLEDTAAAIGIMSDAGIKGSMAGTTLRGALTRLAKPTSAASDLMTHLGIQMFDAQGKIKPMSQIVTELQDGLAGMTNEQKASTLATIFGQEAMNGMMVLVDAGSGKVDTLSKSLENSAGSAEKMATAMQDNVAGTLDEMMGALETAGIELTEALAPTIKEIAEKVTELVGSFNELDDETQQTIIKWLALAAAAGPMLSAIGSMGQGVGTLIKLGGATTKVFGGLKASLSQTSLATKVAVGSVDDLALAAAGAGGAGGVGGLTLALGAALPWIAGITLAVGAGYGAWKLWGEGAYEAGERAKQWGTDVGSTVDGHLDKMQTLTKSTSGQFTNLTNGLTANKNQMSGDFFELGQTIESSLNERITKLDELMANLPETVRSTLTELLSEDKKKAEESLKIVSDNNKRIQEINARATKEKRSATISENQIILDLNRKSAEAYVNTLKISQKERENILGAMNGDVEKSTKKQATSWAKSLAEQRQEMKTHYNEQKETYLASLKELGYNDAAIEEQAKIWDKANEATTQGIDQQLATIAAKYPEIAKEISLSNGQAIASMGEMGEQQIAENEKIIQRAGSLSKELAENAEENAKKLSWVADESKAGAKTWNDIILDQKTGEVKTNVREEVIKAGEDVTTWNEMRFQLHNANLSSNAKSIIGESAIVNGWWDGMAWEDKAVILEDEFSQTAYKALEESGKWNEMSIEEKTAIMYSNTPEKMTETLAYLGLWDEFEPDIKDVNADNTGFIQSIMDSEEKMNYWRSLPDETKEILGDNYDLLTTIFQSEESYNNFKALSDEEKIFLGENSDLMSAVLNSKENYSNWVSMPDNEKRLLANNADLMTKVFSSQKSYDEWMRLPDTLKKIKATSNVPGVSEQSIGALNEVPELKYSRILASSNALFIKGQVDSTSQSADILDSKLPIITTSTNAPVTEGKLKYATTAAQTLNSQAPYIPVSDNSRSTKDNLNATTNAAKTLNYQAPHIPVSDNSSTTKGNLSATTSAAKTLNYQSPYVSADTNASIVKGKIDSARNSAKDKEFTITGWFEKAGDWLNPFNATGNPSFEGGTTWLGDGGKREPYLTPSGNFGVSGSSDELHPLPKGTRIWPSRQSFKTSARSNDYLKQYLDMIPKFATGGTIQNAYDGYSGLVGEAGPEIFQVAQGKVSIAPITQGQRTQALNSVSDGNVDMSETNGLLQSLIQLIAQGQVIQMDGREVGRSIYDEVDSIMNRNFNRGSIMSMKRGD